MEKEERKNKKETDEKVEDKAKQKQEKIEEILVRILSKDIPGNKTFYSGLTNIKGVSWSFANAVCKKLNIKKNKKIMDLDKVEIKKIEDFIKNPDLPEFLFNRRKDYDSGKNRHLNSAELDLQKEFDIKRLKKIKSYKGVRHIIGLPVRGQKTKSNFRKNKRKAGGSVGVKKKTNKR